MNIPEVANHAPCYDSLHPCLLIFVLTDSNLYENWNNCHEISSKLSAAIMIYAQLAIPQLSGISHLLRHSCHLVTLKVLPHSLRSLKTFGQLISCLCHTNSYCPVPFSIINALTQKQFPITLWNFRTGYSILTVTPAVFLSKNFDKDVSFKYA